MRACMWQRRHHCKNICLSYNFPDSMPSTQSTSVQRYGVRAHDTPARVKLEGPYEKGAKNAGKSTCTCAALLAHMSLVNEEQEIISISPSRIRMFSSRFGSIYTCAFFCEQNKNYRVHLRCSSHLHHSFLYLSKQIASRRRCGLLK